MQVELAPLTPEEHARSEALQATLRDTIHQEGPLPFSAFMAACLYHPTWGYYQQPRAPMGLHGDFITSPERTPLFGRTLARWVASQHRAQPHRFNLLEVGPGTGRLAIDVLRGLDDLGCLPERYQALDVSGSLSTLQDDAFANELPPHLHDRVERLHHWPTPSEHTIVLAHEVLDAMPVERVRWDGQRWVTQGVLWDDGWGWCDLPEHTLPDACLGTLTDDAQRLGLPHDAITDVHTAWPSWFRALRDHVQHAHVLCIDYGLHRDAYLMRTEGTLRCHHQHRAHSNPFRAPGCEDLTTQVDLDALTAHAIAAGFEVTHPQSQARFLIDQGICELADHTATFGTADHYRQAQALKHLLFEMGEAFQVVVLSC